MTRWIPNRDFRRTSRAVPAAAGEARGSNAPFRDLADARRRAKPVRYCLLCDRNCGDAKICGSCGYKPEYFPSTGEFRAFMNRRTLEMAGEITELRPHPSFPVKINGIRVLTYSADWQYRDRSGRLVVEEFKGSAKHAGEASTVRRKCAQAYYGINIHVVEK